MNWFPPPSTRAKLFIGFGLMVLLLAVVVGASHIVVERMLSSLERLHGVDFANLLDLKTIRSNEDVIRTGVLTMTSIPKGPALEEQHERIQMRVKENTEKISGLLERNRDLPFLMAKLNEVADIRKEISEIRHGRIIPLIYEGEVREAARLAIGIQGDRDRKMRAVIDDVVKEVEERVGESVSRAGAEVRQTIRTLAILVAVVLIMAVGAVAGMGKEIAERRAAEDRLHELSGHLLRLQDEERRHLGRELHDSVGQYLATLNMELDSLKSEVKREDLSQRFADCIRLTEESITEVRTMSYLLYPPMLDEMGLRYAASWYLDGFTKRSGIRTSFDVPSDLGRLSPASELALFRVLQESLTNIHRHSGSGTAEVRLSLEGGAVRLDVRDRGKGIPPKALESIWKGPGMQGVGLRGMRERIEQLGGRVNVFSDDSGTTVTAILPFERAASSEETPD